jgi:hypothetical protein
LGVHPFSALTGRLVLYPFRFVDPITGRWVRARYLAELHEIAERYAECEITGPAEIRTRGSSGSFNPSRGPSAHLPPVEEPPSEKEPPEREPPDNEPPEPPIEEPPIEDALERLLAAFAASLPESPVAPNLGSVTHSVARP